MNFEKKMKQRFYIAISYIVLGLILTLAVLISKTENYFLPAFGIALLIMGVMRLIQHRRITKDETTMRQRELTETDERNIMMAERARSWAFSLSMMIAGIAVIILSVLGYHDLVQPLAWFVCLMTLLYWLCWMVIRRKY